MLSSDELKTLVTVRLADNAWPPVIVQMYRHVLEHTAKAHSTALKALESLHSSSQNALLRLSSSQHIHSKPTEVLKAYPQFFASGILVLLLLALWLSRRCARPVGSQDLYQPLNALMSIVVPTASRWPSKYLQIARQGLRARRATLLLPLRLVHDDFIRGELELTLTSDLPGLLADTLQSGIWKLHLCADTLYIARVAVWVSMSYMACLVPHVSIFVSPAVRIVTSDHGLSFLSSRILTNVLAFSHQFRPFSRELYACMRSHQS